jgi:hypothetical protein
MSDNKNQPAFPVDTAYTSDGKINGVQTGPQSGFELGLTKREYFAAMALQGLSADWTRDNGQIAVNAVKIADALIAELEK